MGVIKKYLKKKIGSILMLFLLVQSCTVYRAAPVNLEKAYKSNLKTRVVTNQNHVIKFKRIDYEDGKYYGVKKKRGKILKVMINEDNIEKVNIKDKAKSTLVSILVPIVIAVPVYYILKPSFEWKSDKLLSFEGSL
ncbi:hypothetical protein [Aestuariibaculum suncheonense]|uniref:Lipoprotein n=1 Tax=Aestuariibaculum suncheonense TaxID=1028745 RepID=A0A8J6Q9F8_9FLAO|nr:hypothetical protein [Aestuariibaculum suncheonense]MBD0836359.1 hypothetical protein [Aestuariibaculum suncheonense]